MRPTAAPSPPPAGPPRFFAWLAFAAILVGCGRPASSSPAGSGSVPDTLTFAGEVAPILHRECASCHRPGGSAPFPLLTYEQARDVAPAIVQAVTSGRMPPWLPDSGHVPLADPRRLTASEIETLEAWVDGGTPPGDLTRAPEPPELADGWALGEPDLVVSLPEPYMAPAEGRDVYRNLVLPVPVEEARWIQSVEVRPGNRKVVHHAVLMVDQSGSGRELDREDPGPGYDGMEQAGGVGNPDGFFIGWTPGKVPDPGRSDVAWRLEPNTDLVLQLHIRPTGQPEEVAPRIGLHFAPGPPERLPVVVDMGSRTIDIPAGEDDYVLEDEFELPVPVEVLRLYPHAHYLGHEMLATAELPGGETKTLLRIRDWNFDWQDEYRLAEPLRLPAGTVLRMRYSYDNSAANPQNPNDPPQRVIYGPQSTDEMGDLVIQALVVDSADRQALERELARERFETTLAGLEQRVRLQPDDASARHNYGIALREMGRTQEALSHLRAALRLDPANAQVMIDLGTILHETGRVAEAVELYRRALARRPDFTEARFNLAAAHRQSGRTEAAIREYRRALESDPDLLVARVGLAESLLEARRIPEATAEFRRVVRASPERVDARIKLGNLELTQGRHEEAIAHYRRAIEEEPENADLRYNLGLAAAVGARWGLAVESLRRATEIRPQWVAAWVRLTWVLASPEAAGVSDPSEALRAGEEAVRLTSGHPLALEALAAARARAGEYDAAAELAERALRGAVSGGAPPAVRERMATAKQRYRDREPVSFDMVEGSILDGGQG